MKNHPRHRVRAPIAERQLGFTLVELLVAMLIGLLLVLAVLAIQTQMTKTNMQMTDTGQRNDQARVALNALHRDIGNSLFMMNGTSLPCTTTVMHVSGEQVKPVHAVSAERQAASTTLPTADDVAVTAESMRPALASTTKVSDMITIATMPAAIRSASDSGVVPYKVVQRQVASAPAGKGAIENGVLPLNSLDGVTVGDSVTLFVPSVDGVPGANTCLRFKIDSTLAATPGGGGVTAFPAAVQLPTGVMGAFNSELGSADQLSNARLAGAKLKIEGARTNATDVQRIIYYVARVANGDSGSVPVLARATVYADGTLAAQPVPVAAGVVSVQALFGVEPSASGAEVSYVTWAKVVEQGKTDSIRSVRIAIVARTMQSHPDNPVVSSVTVPSPGDGFASYKPSDDEQHDRFVVLTTEVALRNQIWSTRP